MIMFPSFHRLSWSAPLLLVLTLTGLAVGDVTPRATRLHREAIVVDLHTDAPGFLLDEDFDMESRHTEGHFDIPRMKEGGLDAVFMSVNATMRRYHGAFLLRAFERVPRPRLSGGGLSAIKECAHSCRACGCLAPNSAMLSH